LELYTELMFYFATNILKINDFHVKNIRLKSICITFFKVNPKRAKPANAMVKGVVAKSFGDL